jgi:hypothetical protein
MIPAPRSSTPDARVRPAVLEQAKGALMLRLGVDSHEAFSVLLGWARTTHTSVAAIAQMLLREICEGDPHLTSRQQDVLPWLEAQLRDIAHGHDPLADARAAPDGERAHQTPRPT